ncbi:MAG: hypothetical protein NZZ41_04150 [Candidatus Dojkabacteria bacterium]|nr:hypothetical protein [Candidatus Dojkabacteria bacterium]
MKTKEIKIKSVEIFNENTKNKVYDIEVESDHNFFCNNILVNNSCYFSIWPLKDNEEFKNFEWNKENLIQIYDAVVEEMNKSWPEAMKKYFNVKKEKCFIKAGRELVGLNGLFITKKRYAILIFDKEGTRFDINDSPGKLKAMGLDLKRSDTPEKIQDFLESILIDVLNDKDFSYILKRVEQFKKEELNRWQPWEKGTPKRVNNLTSYMEREKNKNDIDLNVKLHKELLNASTEKEREKIRKKIEKIKRLTVPGHVAASLNWNKLCKINNDKFSMPIQDGMKIVVCKLKDNVFNMNSIAYPIDQQFLPDWFKKLPFDEKEMEEVSFYSKLRNLFEVLGWNIDKFKTNTDEDLFQFS